MPNITICNHGIVENSVENSVDLRIFVQNAVEMWEIADNYVENPVENSCQVAI